MKRSPVLILLILFTISSFGQVKQTVTRSSVTFKIKNLGITIDGSFGGLKADIKFDPAHLDQSAIGADVETARINTDNDTRDDHLRSDSFFDVVKYPKITLRSVSFKHRSGKNYTGTFNLTIKDKTNAVEIPFSYTEAGNTAAFKGTLKIDRTDYGVGGNSMVMSDDVIITIDVATTK